MKVTVINGSHHRDGVIASMVDRCIEGIRSAVPEADIARTDLVDLDIEFCQACRRCCQIEGKGLGECIHADAVRPVLEDMLACDRLVLATPIHLSGPTSRMKQFLERCLPAVYWPSLAPKPRNPRSRDKACLILLSSACPAPFNWLMGVTRYPRKALKEAARLYGCSRFSAVQAGDMRDNLKNREKFLRRTFEAGVRLVR